VSGSGELAVASIGANPIVAGNNSGLTGEFLVYNGTVKMATGDANAVGGSSCWVEAFGTLDMNGNSINIGQIGSGGSGVITDNSSAGGSDLITLNSTAAAYTFGGITDAGKTRTIAVTLNSPDDTIYTSTNNNYRGVTTINAGATLWVGMYGCDGDLTGNISNNGTLYFAPATTVTYAGVISGTGSVIVYGYWGSGARTVIFTGANTYTGSTTISYGTLQLGNGSTNGSIAGSSAIVDNAFLNYDETSSQSPGNAISGNGKVTDMDAYWIYLGTHGSFTGTTSGNISL